MHYRAVLLDLCLPIMDGFEAAAVLRQRARLEPPMRSSALVAPYTGAARIVKLTQYGFPLRISFDEAYGRIVDHLPPSDSFGSDSRTTTMPAHGLP